MPGRTTPAFTQRDGLPQGIEVVGDQVLYLTSAVDRSREHPPRAVPHRDARRTIGVPVADEAEGLATEVETNRVFVGYQSADRVDRMSPVLTAPLGVNLLADPGPSRAPVAAPRRLPRPCRLDGDGHDRADYAAGGGYPTAASPGPPSRGSLFFAGGTTSTGRLQRHMLPLGDCP